MFRVSSQRDDGVRVFFSFTYPTPQFVNWLGSVLFPPQPWRLNTRCSLLHLRYPVIRQPTGTAGNCSSGKGARSSGQMDTMKNERFSPALTDGQDWPTGRGWWLCSPGCVKHCGKSRGAIAQDCGLITQYSDIHCLKSVGLKRFPVGMLSIFSSYIIRIQRQTDKISGMPTIANTRPEFWTIDSVCNATSINAYIFYINSA